AAAATGALLEFYRLIEAAGWIVPKPAGVSLLLALVTAAYLASLLAVVVLAGVALLALPTLVLFASPREAVLLASSASSVFATLYIALGAGALVGLRAIGWQPVVFLLAIVWAGDSAAYYVGRRWGKRQLAPLVSPKKTWEGFWGQLGAGLVFGGLAAAVLARFFLRPARDMVATVAAGALLGILISVVAVVGDLVESTFKRSCAVKDSGGLLPGHGGLLDRLDSLLYASPVLLMTLTYFVGGGLGR
ncbi:MAG TPA: phosphatidate cytidylyltransferase, partial [Thermoanaerobaculia bacterium]|nr:phosphatidate cytidylyltransferase [Thermoanaerobaculia bacterium]